jgi:hypothetical protein
LTVLVFKVSFFQRSAEKRSLSPAGGGVGGGKHLRQKYNWHLPNAYQATKGMAAGIKKLILGAGCAIGLFPFQHLGLGKTMHRFVVVCI